MYSNEAERDIYDDCKFKINNYGLLVFIKIFQSFKGLMGNPLSFQAHGIF